MRETILRNFKQIVTSFSLPMRRKQDLNFILTPPFYGLAYLWGIETVDNPDDVMPFEMFLAYLWGIETSGDGDCPNGLSRF